eukprot:gene806-9056_t
MTCSVHLNNFFEMAEIPNSNYSQVTTSVCDSNLNGYSSFSFSNTESIHDITCDYFYHKSERYLGRETKNCSSKDESSENYVRGSWDLTTVHIKIPNKIIEKSKYVIFRCGKNLNNFTTIFAISNITKSSPPCNPFICSRSIGTIYLSWFIFEQIIMIIFLISSIAARNWQPFKSRGIILSIGILADWLTGLIDIIPHVSTVEFAYAFESNLLLTLVVPFKVAILWLIILNFIRMFLVLFIQRNMTSLHEKKIPRVVINSLRFCKYLTSGVGAFVFGFIIFILNSFASIFLVLVFGSFDQRLGDNSTPILVFKRWQDYWDFFLAVIIILLVLLDFLLNIKNFFTNWKKFWIKSDPFRFRVQQIVLIFTFFMFVGNSIIFKIQDSNIRSKTSLSCLSIENRNAHIAMETTSRFSIIFYYSGFILILTIVQKIVSMIKPVKHSYHQLKSDTIDELLQNEKLHLLFKSFVESEFSLENLFLYQDISEYKLSVEPWERISIAIDIFEKYLNGESSELEANIAGHRIKKVQKKIQNQNFSDDLFDAVLDEVKANLSDTYSRFIVSDEYNEYKENEKLIGENTGLIQ